MLEGYDGEYRGVYLNAELQDDENLQRWKRVLIKLLNSAEFSVRSVAIDLFVTLVGEIFDEYGCIDSFTFFILKKLHESKEEWIEAAEAKSFMCTCNLLCNSAYSKCMGSSRRYQFVFHLCCRISCNELSVFIVRCYGSRMQTYFLVNVMLQVH